MNFLYNLETKEKKEKPWQYVGCIWKKKSVLNQNSEE